MAVPLGSLTRSPYTKPVDKPLVCILAAYCERAPRHPALVLPLQASKDNIKTRILPSGSKAQDSRNHALRDLHNHVLYTYTYICIYTLLYCLYRKSLVSLCGLMVPYTSGTSEAPAAACHGLRSPGSRPTGSGPVLGAAPAMHRGDLPTPSLMQNA